MRHCITQCDGNQTICEDRCLSCGCSIYFCECVQFDCGHIFCNNCIKHFISYHLQNKSKCLCCPFCCKSLRESEIDRIEKGLSNKFDFEIDLGPNIHSCPNCKEKFYYEPGDKPGITIDNQGRKIKPDALECLRLNRCTCIKCQTNFCIECKCRPFHDGYTCLEQQLINDGIVCRFCDEPFMGDINKTPVELRVCNNPECQSYMSNACLEVLECGHPCPGIRGEKEHLPCSECVGLPCAICGDPMKCKPCITMECGHHAHLQCVQQVFKSASDKGLIKLPKCSYPGCNKIPSHDLVKELSSKYIELHQKIELLIPKLIESEKIRDDEHVKNPEDEDYFEKPEVFARSVFLFFKCDKCGEPYFGGRKECNQEQQDNIGGPYLCQKCGIVGAKTCPKHGNDGMLFKCFFCCNPASFHCWGTTHFCSKCHDNPGQSMNNPKPCDGKCQFYPHPPNGTREYFGKCNLCMSGF